ncbi:MAG: lipoprotein signal peptidase [Chroococcidiopsidaceae cyanobacterium CP_BM_ER_R8_30]|nr:lipoprotein signal peptidase [Chroococcidiopsidaceae cyanobacterium CP_BM_ER_R8_30]
MRLKNGYFWLAATISLLLDWITKSWVMQNLSLGETRPILPGVFNLTYIVNHGAALGLFRNGSEWLRWLSLSVSLFLIALAWFGPSLSRWEQLGYGLILGGALGNGIGRFVAGGVTDFLDFRPIQFPWVFNLADAFIDIGIACLLLASFQKSPPNRRL